MQLSDAVERWGVDNRPRLDQNKRDTARLVWATVRSSQVADLDIQIMTKEESKAVMNLFDESDREAVAGVLNAVRDWSTGRVSLSNPPVHRRPRVVDKPDPVEQRLGSRFSWLIVSGVAVVATIAAVVVFVIL